MKTMYIFSRLLCLLIIFSNCSKNDQEKFEPGMLKGKVTDAETGLPIVSATIIIGSSVKIVHTDGNGEYTASIDGGEYIITARKEGYLDATSNAKVDGSTEVVNFQLQDKPLNPGQAKVKGQLDGLDLSTWNASCKYIGDTLKITASATYQSGSGILIIHLVNPCTGSFVLNKNNESYITYLRTLFGYTREYSSKIGKGNVNLSISSFDIYQNYIKGSMSGILDSFSFTDTISNGYFRGYW